MGKYQHFEDLPVWQEAARLYHAVLDLVEQPHTSLPAGFRDQLNRAALSVSNNIAEGFERSTTRELLSFISIARASAGEVRSMMSLMKNRPQLQRCVPALDRIRSLAVSCTRQLTAWTASIEESHIVGKRHLSAGVKEQRKVAERAREFRLEFLRRLKPEHPLFNTPEARVARGEAVE